MTEIIKTKEKIMDNLIKATTEKLIYHLKNLIDGNILNKGSGICVNIGLEMPDIYINFNGLFHKLGYENTVYPVGGLKEFINTIDKWDGESGKKRRVICRELIDLLQKTVKKIGQRRTWLSGVYWKIIV